MGWFGDFSILSDGVYWIKLLDKHHFLNLIKLFKLFLSINY